MAKIFAQTINDAQLMAAALDANLELLRKRGMTREFIEQLESSIKTISLKNIEQERLKGELHAATASIKFLKEQLHSQMKEAVKVVKLDIPQPQWKEYGIADKR
jgi:hypothetical protein